VRTLRASAYLLAGALLFLVAAIAAWLFVDAIVTDCGDAGRRPYQLVSSGLTLAAVAAAAVGVYGGWRRARIAWLFPAALPVLALSGLFALALVGCGG
jgi:hypothetical protein